MTQAPYEVLPWFAAVGFIVIGALHVWDRHPLRGAWIAPAMLATIFLGWSMFTIFTSGLVTVWVEHTRNAWANQIWFDLLLAAGLALTLLFPRARAVGMHPLPWLLIVAGTGSIGLYAMLARLMYLEDRRGPRVRVD